MRLVERVQELRRCILDPWGGYIFNILGFVKLKALTEFLPVDPLPGVFKNRGSYLEF